MSAPNDDDWGPPPLSLRDSRFAGERATHPWSWRLSLFLRAMSLLELCKGLFHWAQLVAAEPAGDAGWFATHVLFSVADPVAAVGLWVGAPWGVAVWLIAAAAQIAVSALGGPTALGWFAISAAIAAVTAYVALSMQARRESF